MFPGLPVMALGRNEHIAWGGTNMHAASSDLFDIGGIPAAEIIEREETIKVRWSRSRTVRVRETEFGPVLSDAPVLKGLSKRGFAIRWVGHDPSDEFTALLAVSRARNWSEFRRAFATFAVSGMNMLYADVAGNIGQVLAVRLPAREGVRPPDLVLDPSDESVLWSGFVGPDDLPHSYNPPENFLVSANNRPAETRIPLGYMFSPDDRVQRITALLARLDKVRLADLREIQQDVFTPSAVALRDLLVEKMTALGIAAEAAPAEKQLLTWLAAWDGNYRRESRGALAFEILVYCLSTGIYGPVFAQAENATYASVGRIKNLLEKDIQEMEEPRLKRRLQKALTAATKRFQRYDDWGDMHRLGLWHPLGALPVIGRRFRFFAGPTGGSGDTVMKTAHGSTDRRHYVRYGAAARHISDLADMDENYFALLGGQDGWLASSTFADQIPTWLERTYVRVPLRLETVRRTFAHRTVLTSAQAPAEITPVEGGATWPAVARRR
jgi:penicillin amidase